VKLLGDGHEGAEEAEIEFGRHASLYPPKPHSQLHA
jgi:hypothetical protein